MAKDQIEEEREDQIEKAGEDQKAESRTKFLKYVPLAYIGCTILFVLTIIFSILNHYIIGVIVSSIIIAYEIVFLIFKSRKYEKLGRLILDIAEVRV